MVTPVTAPLRISLVPTVIPGSLCVTRPRVLDLANVWMITPLTAWFVCATKVMSEVSDVKEHAITL